MQSLVTADTEREWDQTCKGIRDRWSLHQRQLVKVSEYFSFKKEGYLNKENALQLSGATHPYLNNGYIVIHQLPSLIIELDYENLLNGNRSTIELLCLLHLG